MDQYGRQAYIRDYDPADRIAQAKAAIARNRAAAEAKERARQTGAKPDLDPGEEIACG